MLRSDWLQTGRIAKGALKCGVSSEGGERQLRSIMVVEYRSCWWTSRMMVVALSEWKKEQLPQKAA